MVDQKRLAVGRMGNVSAAESIFRLYELQSTVGELVDPTHHGMHFALLEKARGFPGCVITV